MVKISICKHALSDRLLLSSQVSPPSVTIPYYFKKQWKRPLYIFVNHRSQRDESGRKFDGEIFVEGHQTTDNELAN